MSILTKSIKIPAAGLKYEFSPNMLDEIYTPRSLNVHGVNSEIWTKPGISSFSASDQELKLYLKYDTGDDSQVGLRIGSDNNIKLAQSVTTSSAARTIDTITLKLKVNGTIAAGKKVFVTIEPDESGPSGTPITGGTSGDVLCSAIGAEAGWITFTLPTAITLDASTIYWIVLQGDYDVSATNYVDWSIDATSSPYTDGAAYVFDASWAAIGADQDFMFRIYRDVTTIMFTDTFYLTSGTSYLMVATLDRLFYHNSGNDTWVDVSGYLAANLFSGTVDDRFCADTYPAIDTFIITNYVNSIKKWTGTGLCANLGGSPPRAKYLKVYKDHLVLGFIYEESADHPQRVSWSASGDIEVHTGADSGYRDFYEGIDFINGLFLLDNYLVVTKERSIHLGYPVESSNVFDFDQKVFGIGPLSREYVLEKGTELLMVTWDDVYAFNGAALTHLADGYIRQELFDSTDPQHVLRGFSLDIEEQGEWHIFVPSAGADYPDTVWVFNYKKKAWWKYSLTVPVTCAGWSVEVAGFTIADLVGTIDQQIWRIDDRSIVGFNGINLVGTYNGLVGKINNQVGEEFENGVEAYIDTKDFYFTDDLGKRIRGKVMGITIEVEATKFYVYYSIDGGISYHILTVGGVTPEANYNIISYKFRKQVKQIRFRIYKSAIGESFKIRAIDFDVLRGGRL